MPKINSLEVVHQDTNKDSYDNLHDLLVSIKETLGILKEGDVYKSKKEIIDGQARAAYETLLEMYVNDKEAFAQRIETLTAEFGTSIAQIIEDWTVYASATEAYAKKIEEVSSKVFENESKVTQEIYARTTADEALAKLISTLEATFNNESTRTRASIVDESVVRATADSALASRITTLTAQTETQIATVTTYAEAVAAETARKVSTYNQPEPPTGSLAYGDLWFDSNNNNRLYWWNGIVWSESSDTYNLTDFITNTYTVDYAAIESQVDSKAETWFQTTDPSTAWTTTDLRNQHDKDLWYNASTNLLQVYVASSNTWTVVQDQTAINAAAAASTAQTTANGKIVTYVQSTTPAGSAVGDLWMDTANNRQMKRWNGSSWVAVDDTRIGSTYARWGVQVDANGRVAGIQLNSSSTGSSEFTVLADSFKVYKSGSTSDPMFTVGTVNGTTTVGIKGTLLLDSSVGTRGIAGNAVTVPSFFQNATDVPYIGNTPTTICTGTVVTSGYQPIVVTFSSGIGGAANNGVEYYNAGFVDCSVSMFVENIYGTVIASKPVNYGISIDSGIMRLASGSCMFTSTEVPAGTYYFKLKATLFQTIDGVNVKGLLARYPSFTVLETKR